MKKSTINKYWIDYINRQVKGKISFDLLSSILRKENYSNEIINDIINSYKNINDLNYIFFSPKIYTIDAFISDNDCDNIISLTNNNLKRSLVADEDNNFLSNGRTSYTYWVNHNHNDITFNIANKISKLVDIPLENAEQIQIVHYKQNQKYDPHYDGWVFDGSEKSRKYTKNGGQRLITVIGYLNNVKKGGETFFSKLDISIKPEKGKILVFKNVHNNTNILHYLSEHSGRPVIEGEKYIFTLWFREIPLSKEFDYKIIDI